MQSSNSSQSNLLPHFRSSLEKFSSAHSTFLVLHTLPPPSEPHRPPPLRTLHVLDSSFNPPTRAHLRIALSALRSSTYPKPHRLLLLLATQNADKAPKPAAFEQRLAMMTVFAQDLLDKYSTSPSQNTSSYEANRDDLAVDIGVTKKPYYNDKAVAIEESRQYADAKTNEQPQQVHLLGFDSLIRLLDRKYYPPDHTLALLNPFFERHRVRVTMRSQEGTDWGYSSDQERYLEVLAKGGAENVGGKREWVERIELVEGEGEDVSSTKVREYSGKKNWDEVEKLVGKRTKEWIENEGLYMV
ncbi:MAG: hypothetical protein LQ350_004648 [Teloschistes chrysophthalmus]|nr:MAG: hypothetical protein LQ350_004648 [Niorma chrysophthalma]